MMRQKTVINNELLCNSGRGVVLFGLMIMALVLVASVERSNAQRVYGVSAARRTTVVSNGSGTVVRSTTVVAARSVGLPAGYIAVLPAGYRVVSGGFYVVGSVRYRARFYQGRTVYVRV